jgi:hypothetical protein
MQGYKAKGMLFGSCTLNLLRVPASCSSLEMLYDGHTIGNVRYLGLAGTQADINYQLEQMEGRVQDLEVSLVG